MRTALLSLSILLLCVLVAGAPTGVKTPASEIDSPKSNSGSDKGNTGGKLLNSAVAGDSHKNTADTQGKYYFASETDKDENAADTKGKHPTGRQSDNPVGTRVMEDENIHYFAYFVTGVVLVAILYIYIAKHNKRKIIIFVLEGKNSRSTRRPKSSNYQKLEQHM
ncbi:trans-Golgi network integral membrane protein 2-like [Xiphophorus hellerii]|uniref:trans-Golgi network integral membrane protein 2-like n=1 Tax=Xiphophorus hellerii TaxID=8084 RepID=UPI0013B44E8F|nr:trans-Golgi network integral membrane protein 2-like [Xiphophorus hellerii]